ncbi:MAG: T9SS type A sorting domain-containing protein [Bacteroidales bacterium]|nr:T9SS type A sorting domain-containing protein [Bacteroidales bacterium]
MKAYTFYAFVCFFWCTLLHCLGQPAWYGQNSPVNADLVSVSFTDTMHGWILGKNGEVLITQNGGDNWELATTVTNFKATKIFFLNENYGWITGFSADGSYGRALFSENSGYNWIEKIDSLSIYFNDVFFIDENHGWIVGYDTLSDTTNYIIYTSDAGLKWERQMTNMFLAGAMRNVHFRDANHGNIYGTGRFFLLTSDGGQHWWLSIYNWQIDLMGIYNAGDKYGCMVGSGGKVYITKDNWVNSVSYELPFSDTLRAISGLEKLKYWAVGDNGSIVQMAYVPAMYLLIINDQSYSTFNRLNDVSAVCDSNVWAVGDNGTILHFGMQQPVNPIVIKDIVQDFFTVYPNPSGNYVIIDQKHSNNFKASIINDNGTKLSDLIVEPGNKIAIGHLQPGTYFLKIYNNTECHTSIIIKK